MKFPEQEEAPYEWDPDNIYYDPRLPWELGGLPDWCKNIDFKCAPSPGEVLGMKDRGEWNADDWPMLKGMSGEFCAMKMLQLIMAYSGCDQAIERARNIQTRTTHKLEWISPDLWAPVGAVGHWACACGYVLGDGRDEFLDKCPVA